MAAISGERARDYVAALASARDRISGTEAEHQSAQRVRELLSPYVDRCQLEGWPVVAYTRSQGRLEVIAPVQRHIPCEVNPVAGSGAGEGLLVDAGNGARPHYQGLAGRIAGQVALVTNDAPRRGGWYPHLALEAKQWGASCLVYHNPAIRDDAISVWVIDVDLPVLSISNQVAAELRGLLAEHGQLRVSYQAAVDRLESTTYNVVGTVRGSDFPDEVIYLSGHHDSFFYGANDNISTVACVLELASALKGQRPRRTWRFIAWGSEESGAEIGTWGVYGLIGSYGYGQTHLPQLTGDGELALALLNGEFMGATPRTHIQCTPELIPFAREVAGELGDHLEVSGPSVNWTMSDHLCFNALGVPILYFLPARDRGTGGRSPYWTIYHTEKDDLDHISARALEENSRLLALLALRLDAADLPYSLDSLIGEALRGTGSLPNHEPLQALLQRGKAYCLEAADRVERLRRALRLTRAVHRNIYAFNRPFGQKFALMEERIARLRDAYHILDMEGDLDRARAALCSIADFNAAANYSAETVNEVRRVREGCPVVRGLAVVVADWSDLLESLVHPESPQAILSSLEAKVAEARDTANNWGREFEDALEAL